MGEERHDGLAVPGRVVLAREAPFTLGRLQVVPFKRQVIGHHGSETLEPRVMQVLVALARANGDVVTRDELIETCWEGRFVGDDAINRTLSRIRQIAAGIGQSSFSVETITKVGYRVKIHSTGERGVSAASDANEGLPFSRRRLLIGVAATTGAAGLGVGAWLAVPRKHEPSPLATLYYERGIESRGQNSLSYGEQAVAYFREATRIDPQYADAWGALAWGYRTLLEYGSRSDSDNVAMHARSAANRALELDPSNADAQAALLLLKPFYRNWSEIERECSELLGRHPNHSISRYNLAHVIAETGRWRESIPHCQELAAREPSWPLARMQLCRALFNAGRLDEAELQIREALTLWPRRLDIWSTRIRQLLLTGRTSEAMAFLENEPGQPVDNPQFIELDRLIARAYVNGSQSLRQRAVDRLLEQARSGVPGVLFAALDLSFLEEVDTAFSLLEGFFFARGRWADSHPHRPSTGFLFNAMSAPLRRDPRFQPLLEETGLEAFWRSTGTLPDYRRYT